MSDGLFASKRSHLSASLPADDKNKLEPGRIRRQSGVTFRSRPKFILVFGVENGLLGHFRLFSFSAENEFSFSSALSFTAENEIFFSRPLVMYTDACRQTFHEHFLRVDVDVARS